MTPEQIEMGSRIAQLQDEIALLTKERDMWKRNHEILCTVEIELRIAVLALLDLAPKNLPQPLTTLLWNYDLWPVGKHL